MATAADFDELGPIKLVELGEGRWSVIFSPGGSADTHCESAFAVHGLEGNGYDWSGAVQALLAKRAPDVRPRVGLDPEAGMFSAYGGDLDALHTVAVSLHTLIEDTSLLAAALADAAELDLLD